ncbi:MAG: HAMP domain-containing histidine kinase [Candidatus Marinimicrobia bacterium]|jgi:signal transduction histidine kinase|nr:HAMP domain-containing histidine kinase [Candidatus Neomarinimicrobiota bacterium]MBT3633555.1 HAMP domain-containing histidine kinase [Candidatus Neomarinimicrobiota bacterium]MBT3682492.1 HAMP domain-containing histidine kinase [Candidatus Neomarinimicrobiota bacterium]MBT3759256.1 HAMP domain-containing histidine kinase [Candidatus Neomarinimicrobiota bacterium]MBT3895471.1 HAMP domain-containing histidine kinase [Candidatus Neomarinimicrobiota bacterium]
MKNFIRSFYFKLAVVFLGVLLIMTSIQILMSLKLTSRFINKVDQQLNINLARDMAIELDPLFKEADFNWDKIGERIHYMMVINPKIEIYVLNDTGKILVFFAEPGKKMNADYVDLDPVEIFLKENSILPILGFDPRNPSERKPFSATRMKLNNGAAGYLYIIIGSEQYDQVTALFRENFILRTLILGLVISAIFAATLGLILFARLTRRIRTLSQFVSDFEQENYSSRIPTSSPDEIGKLGNTFNSMADRIVSSIDELKNTDILRRELIANVSHDLRSPLASIQGYIETIQIKEDTLSNEDRNKYLDIILNSTISLNLLVHELFDLSKLEAKQVEPNMENLSIGELVNDIVIKYNVQAKKRQTVLRAEIDLDPAGIIQADIGLLERALSNLIINAIEHTPENGLITVAVNRSISNKIEISISDTGPGIPEEDLSNIFERYFHGSRNYKQKTASTGLGLPIAIKIIELHNSTINVKNQKEGGAVFTIELTEL